MEVFSRRLSLVFAVLILVSPVLLSGNEETLRARAERLAQELLILDTHVDVPYRLYHRWENISIRTSRGNFDYPRAKSGGLNVPFMAIYVPADREKRGAKKLADTLIMMVEKFASDWPDKFALARNISDTKRHFTQGLVSLAMGMENGAPIEGKLENVKYFYDRGIRYITLTHSQDNHICDSSYDTTRTWKGLSPFGKKLISEMNRVGMMIDVSHITDEAFYQVIELSKAPVIASHSSCRNFTPGWERNMSDDMIKLMASKGGIIMINFGSSFLSQQYLLKEEANRKEIAEYLRKSNLRSNDPKAQRYIANFHKQNPLPFADVQDIVAHINHVVKIAGIDYVGIGSDFDGLGDSLPTGMKDVSQYPNLIYELLKAGYSEKEIKKICSDNFFRVWGEVEQVAEGMRKENPK